MHQGKVELIISRLLAGRGSGSNDLLRSLLADEIEQVETSQQPNGKDEEGIEAAKENKKL
jgi:hypothetical protein